MGKKRKRAKKSSFRLSYILILLGMLIMLIGAYSTLLPLSSVSVGPVSISGISATSATLIGIGAILFLAGIGLYLKHK